MTTEKNTSQAPGQRAARAPGLASLLSIAADLHWMARRYVDGRQSCATGLFNEHTRALLALGAKLNPTADGTIWARDAMGRSFDGLSADEAAMGGAVDPWPARSDEELAVARKELREARETASRLAAGNARALAVLDNYYDGPETRGGDAIARAMRELENAPHVPSEPRRDDDPVHDVRDDCSPEGLEVRP